MAGSSSDTDASRINAIRDCWEQFDNTGDEEIVLDYLADEVVLLPPGDEPIRGKTAVAEVLREFPSGAYDVEHTPGDMVISGDLAVDYVSIEGSELDDDGERTDDVSLKAIDVYRRDEQGDWKMMFSIWNDQV